MLRRNRTAAYDAKDLSTSFHRVLRPEERPLGLVGELVADSWEFDFNVGPRKARRPWTRKMANGLKLSHPSNHRYFSMCRRVFTAFHNKQFEGSSDISFGSIESIVGVLCLLIDDTISFGKTTIAELNKDEWEAIKKRAAISRGMRHRGERNTVSRILFIFNVYNDLHKLFSQPDLDGHYILDDGPSDPVFDSEEEARSLASVLGGEQGKTPDIPEKLAFPLLNAAIEYVAIFSQDIINLQVARREYFSLGPQPRHPKIAALLRRVEILQFLLNQYDQGDTTFWPDMKLDRKRLAEKFNLGPDAIKLPRYDVFIGRFNSLLCTSSRDDLEWLRNHLDEARAAVPNLPERRRRTINNRLMGLPFKGTEGRHAPWPVRNTHGIKMQERNLWISAYIVVAMFMADRAGEILSLETNCLIEKLDGHYLRIPVFKETGRQAGTYVERPCPAIVAKAIAVMVELGRASREATGSDLLFMLVLRPGDNVASTYTLNFAINRFAKDVGAHLSDGESWNYTSHQFRRLFVTIWVSYFEYGGNIEALRKFLGHSDVRTTVHYATGVNQGEALSEKRKELTLRIMKTIAFDGRAVQGGAGKYLMNFMTRVRVRLVPENFFGDWVAHAANRLNAMFSPMAWGYCVWTKFAGKRAKCVSEQARRVGIERPDHRELCENCSNCGNFLTTDAFDAFWISAFERHDKVARNEAAPKALRAAAEAGRATAARYLEMETLENA